ncbi:MAG TPA: S41 family peptidase [Cyclobacteriaceae bacterium]|jgi:C-terminal processing protease CtpA/Prc|nr:S41 family peptidase [Cyclobacteriaceae bacterium]
MRQRTWALAIGIFFFSCKKEKTQYEVFFDKTFAIIKNKSIRKNELDWSKIEKSVKDSIGNFRDNNDVYNGIGYTLRLINDGHSIFSAPASSFPLNNKSLSIPEVQSKIVGNKIGYLKLTGYFANDSLSGLYALKIRRAFKKLDNSMNLSGWIIDLTDNGGGKMSTMPLGLSPLFQDSVIGYAINNKGEYGKQICTSNIFSWNVNKIDSIDFDSTLKNGNKKIAVLVNSKTASAGEFLSLAFKFQKNAKIFGTKTKGKTSHLELVLFGSKAKLLICTQYMCDHNKKAVQGPLIPDVECAPAKSLELAIDWIE